MEKVIVGMCIVVISGVVFASIYAGGFADGAYHTKIAYNTCIEDGGSQDHCVSKYILKEQGK
jgi:hypothetical protein